VGSELACLWALPLSLYLEGLRCAACLDHPRQEPRGFQIAVQHGDDVPAPGGRPPQSKLAHTSEEALTNSETS
jgi:hypothetical protein